MKFVLKIVKSVRNITAEFDENILVNLHKIQISISLIRQIKFSFSESLDWNEVFTENSSKCAKHDCQILNWNVE